jgi:hypothetical protein
MSAAWPLSRTQSLLSVCVLQLYLTKRKKAARVVLDKKGTIGNLIPTEAAFDGTPAFKCHYVMKNPKVRAVVQRTPRCAFLSKESQDVRFGAKNPKMCVFISKTSRCALLYKEPPDAFLSPQEPQGAR